MNRCETAADTPQTAASSSSSTSEYASSTSSFSSTSEYASSTSSSSSSSSSSGATISSWPEVSLTALTNDDEVRSPSFHSAAFSSEDSICDEEDSICDEAQSPSLAAGNSGNSMDEIGGATLPLWKHRDRRRRKPPLIFGTRGPGSLYRKAKSLMLLATRDRAAALSFLRADFPQPFPLWDRLKMIQSFISTTDAIRCFHTQAEMLVVTEELFQMGRPEDEKNGRRLTVVECGVAKGASSAKLSLVVHRLGGELHLYDSFRGIPSNDEKLTRLDGSKVVFFKGAFTGRIPTVTGNLERFGRPECVTLHKGLFQNTMPGELPDVIDLALLDVDLLSSTQTCLENIYPRLRPGGVIYSQDGHIREIATLIGQQSFWMNLRAKFGCPLPEVCGLWTRKFIRIRRPRERKIETENVDRDRPETQD